NRRHKVQVFGDPLATFASTVGLNRAAREIEIQGPCDIHPAFAYEQPEGRPDARIDVQNLVQTVSRVEAVANVEYASVADFAHETSGELVNGLVFQTNAKAGGTGVDRALADFLAGEA